MAINRLPKYELDRCRRLYPDDGHSRPRTLAECPPEPCPYAGCKYHLYLDVNELTGSIKFNFPDLEPDDLDCTCALRVAGMGESTLQEIGDAMNLTRERARQMVLDALAKFVIMAERIDVPLEELFEASVGLDDQRCAAMDAEPAPLGALGGLGAQVDRAVCRLERQSKGAFRCWSERYDILKQGGRR